AGVPLHAVTLPPSAPAPVPPPVPAPVVAAPRSVVTTPPLAAAPPPAPAPKPVPAPAAAKAPPTNGVAATLLAVVSEKTGYPAESLDLGLSLDADLGVDSIKRVEILSALREWLPGAPEVKPEHLGTLHTLRDVADFLAGPQIAAPATTKIPITPVD